MTNSRDGVLIFEDVLDAVVVHFERLLPYSPVRVWERLLSRDHLTEWLTSEPGGYIRRHTGGGVRLPTIGGATIESEVIEFIPETSLLFGWETVEWDGGVVGWTLEREDDGTTLTFDLSEDLEGADHFARALATWHMTLDRFEASLSGAPMPWTFEAWEKLFYGYGRSLIHQLGLE